MMRKTAIALLLCAGAAPASQSGEPLRTGARGSPLAGADCPDSSSHLAGKGDAWRHQPLKPQRLGELPPANAFAAVYKLDERGCLVPVMYRDIQGGR